MHKRSSASPPRGTRKRGVDRKEEFIPLIARAFIEQGYSRTTTAEVAKRCGVQENELYRIWPSKQAMFVESIRHIYTETTTQWELVLKKPSKRPIIERLIAFQAKDHGGSGFYRLVYCGLAEMNDTVVHQELGELYRKFHCLIVGYIRQSRRDPHRRSRLTDEELAWAIMGVASVVDVQRELGLLEVAARGKILSRVSLNMLRHLS